MIKELQAKMIAFEKRNKIHISIEICSDFSGYVREFWDEYDLFKFDTVEQLDRYLKEEIIYHKCK